MEWTREAVVGDTMVLQYLSHRAGMPLCEATWITIKVTHRWVPAQGWVKVD